MKDKDLNYQWADTPTNRYAAKRPYCYKHRRAMLDIGGQKKCPTCQDEQRKTRPAARGK